MDKTVRLWAVETGTEVARFSFAEAVVSVAFSPDSSKLAIGVFSGKVELLDLGQINRPSFWFLDEVRQKLGIEVHGTKISRDPDHSGTSHLIPTGASG